MFVLDKNGSILFIVLYNVINRIWQLLSIKKFNADVYFLNNSLNEHGKLFKIFPMVVSVKTLLLIFGEFKPVKNK